VIVNPTNMLGPRDAKPSSGIIILLALQRHVGRFNITPQTPTILNFIHARDAACGVLAAMEKGRIAESYILGNQSLSYAELFDAIESILEIKLHRLMVPAWLIGIMGWFGDLSERMKGRPLPLNRINARSLITGRYFSSAKAIEELQLPQTDLNIALVDALVWFRDHGYLHPHLVLKASQLVPGVTPG